MKKFQSIEMSLDFFLKNASREDFVIFIKLLEEKRIEAGKKLLDFTDITYNELCVTASIPALREKSRDIILEMHAKNSLNFSGAEEKGGG